MALALFPAEPAAATPAFGAFLGARLRVRLRAFLRRFGIAPGRADGQARLPPPARCRIRPGLVVVVVVEAEAGAERGRRRVHRAERGRQPAQRQWALRAARRIRRIRSRRRLGLGLGLGLLVTCAVGFFFQTVEFS